MVSQVVDSGKPVKITIIMIETDLLKHLLGVPGDGNIIDLNHSNTSVIDKDNFLVAMLCSYTWVSNRLLSLEMTNS